LADDVADQEEQERIESEKRQRAQQRGSKRQSNLLTQAEGHQDPWFDPEVEKSLLWRNPGVEGIVSYNEKV
jgi:hypothetical protein